MFTVSIRGDFGNGRAANCGAGPVYLTEASSVHYVNERTVNLGASAESPDHCFTKPSSPMNQLKFDDNKQCNEVLPRALRGTRTNNPPPDSVTRQQQSNTFCK